MNLTKELLEKRLREHKRLYGPLPEVVIHPRPCERCKSRYNVGYQAGYSAGRRHQEKAA